MNEKDLRPRYRLSREGKHAEEIERPVRQAIMSWRVIAFVSSRSLSWGRGQSAFALAARESSRAT